MNPEKNSKDRKKLRYGFTTGTCAAAATVAAYKILTGVLVDVDEFETFDVETFLPNGKKLTLPVKVLEKNDVSVKTEIIKDAGDDPDITDGIAIRAQLFFMGEGDVPDERDYIMECGGGVIVLSVAEGVGVVTKPGLDAERGKWAINIVPRQMIRDNLEFAGFGERDSEKLTVRLTAVNGGELALKTLNKMLGVVGGISILGTTGIVVPYSNAAYKETIRILLRSLAAEGNDETVLATGNRTKKLILSLCPHLKEESVIRIGDFIGASLKFAGECGLKKVNIACMPGKLYKYACGLEYTHAHSVALNMDLMISELRRLKVNDSVVEEVERCASIAEISEKIEQKLFRILLRNFAEQALSHACGWNENKSTVKLYVFNGAGELLMAYGNDDGDGN